MEYIRSNVDIGIGFFETGDFIRTSEYHLAGVLERGVRVLLYDGTYDLVWWVLLPIRELSSPIDVSIPADTSVSP